MDLISALKLSSQVKRNEHPSPWNSTEKYAWLSAESILATDWEPIIPEQEIMLKKSQVEKAMCFLRFIIPSENGFHCAELMEDARKDYLKELGFK